MFKVIGTGRLTKEPNFKFTPSNIPVCEITIATDRPFLNSEQKYNADFVEVECWRKLAEVVSKQCGKGDMVLIEGILLSKSRSSKDGQQKWKDWYVRADRVEFLCKSRKNSDRVPEDEVPSDEGDPGEGGEDYREFEGSNQGKPQGSPSGTRDSKDAKGEDAKKKVDDVEW